ncbi:Rpn family recombination-promoting nuclease/putative transposase [Accumulibacter sp.]|uniref:Rpn family recombination-promoting nuclease/putative transposase n=1 Tax=Accumulibacter sp. TaxID=2053492 RepID=UPI002D1FB16E|nr:Rpn family recombination-promoting nuclease/putative transposase [Accumulibacter sp.]
MRSARGGLAGGWTRVAAHALIVGRNRSAGKRARRGVGAGRNTSSGELAEGKLPPILPVVLYNGHPPWRAAVEVADLFAPAPRGLEAFRPRLAYHLIDEARLMRHAEPSVRTAVEALFRLEHSRTPEDLRQIIQALDALQRNPANAGIRDNFVVWIKSPLRRKACSTTLRTMRSASVSNVGSWCR